MDFDDFDNKDENFDPERLDAEWVGLNALRETLRIAFKGQAAPTYSDTLRVARDLAPELYHPNVSVLAQAQEQPAVREYRQRALAESELRGLTVSPVEVINREIGELERLLTTHGERDRIESKIRTLETIKLQLQDRPYTENQLLMRDTFKAARSVHLVAPPIERDTYTEYRLPFDRGLRIRLLHPDRPEHVTGADLIYEIYSNRDRLVRLALVQYKVWDGEVLYLSEERLHRQLERLRACSCSGNLCRNPEGETKAYRLPHCASFLRPTDRLQSPSSRLISRGLHIPLCVVDERKENTSRNGEMLLRRAVEGRAISQRIFEELFNRNMLGSRWLRYEEIEKFYHTYEIFRPEDRLLVHAQDFWLSEERGREAEPW